MCRYGSRCNTERPACAGSLFMSGDFYQAQAVLCSSVGYSPEFVLRVLMMHHPRHHNVYQKGLLTCSKLLPLTWESLTASFSSCSDEALPRRDTYSWPVSTVCSGRDWELDMFDSRQTSIQEQMALRLHWGLCLCVRTCVSVCVPVPRKYGCQKDIILHSSQRLIQKRPIYLSERPTSHKIDSVPS